MGGAVNTVTNFVSDVVGGATDFVSNTVQDTANFVSNTVQDTANFVSNTVSNTTDFVSNTVQDTTNFIGDVVQGDFSNAWGDIRNIGHGAVNYLANEVDNGLNLLDNTSQAFGVKGSVKFLQNVSAGARWVGNGIIDGNKTAIITGVTTAAAIIIMILFPPSASFLAPYIGSFGAGLVTIAMYAYAIYSIMLPFAKIGEVLKSGGLPNLIAYIQQIKDMMALSFTKGWTNGTMGRWMAGGVLYDSPRAGDLLFNPTGSLATTKFLGLQDHNMNLQAKYGIYGGDVHGRMLGPMAGDNSFSVAKKTMMF